MQKLWQIFDEDNIEILENTSFISYTYTASGQIAQMPLEEGSFAQYNKVNQAGILRLSLAFSGSDSESVEILARLESEKSRPSKLQILSPEKIFNNYSLQSFSYKKEANLGILLLDLEFQEIREIDIDYSTLSLSALAITNPADASKIVRGQVQSLAANSAIISKISSYF